MQVQESPNIPFSILYERFSSGIMSYKLKNTDYTLFIIIAPKVIVYDNGCNLHQYCLNREPDYFRESRFLVDRFHWPNHTGNKNIL